MPIFWSLLEVIIMDHGWVSCNVCLPRRVEPSLPECFLFLNNKTTALLGTVHAGSRQAVSPPLPSKE